MTIRLLFAMALGIGLQCAGPASAQEWPAHPMTMVVAFPAGGSDDILGRIIASRMSELLGQPVNVETVAGGGGATATAQVVKAAPDGYRFMLGTSATHALSQVLRKTPPYDASADFAPAIRHLEFAMGNRSSTGVNGGKPGAGAASLAEPWE